MGNLGLSFDSVVTSEDCRSYKPRKEIFEKALDLMGVDAEEVVHIGDSFSSDVLGAYNAGIDGIWINRKGRVISCTDADKVTLEVGNLGELAAYFS